MSELTPGASFAWKAAAAEAGSSRHGQIERSHLFVGICSLEKVVALPEDVDVGERAAILAEHARLQDLFSRLGLDAARLRRSLRTRLGTGTHAPDGQAISRSGSCKAAFQRAEAQAGKADVGTLHLMAAVLEERDPILEAVLDDSGVGVVVLREQARAEIARAGPASTAPGREPGGGRGDLGREGENGVEATAAETIEILRGLRSRWEQHQRVRIEDAALEAAVELAVRFDTTRRLPDKAVDLVEKAAALGGDVTDLAVARVLAGKLGLSLELVTERLGGAGHPRLPDLEPLLRGRLVGQEDAIARVCQRLRVSSSGMRDRRGPLAIFLFLGPTGVGKTQMARLLAEFLFGSASEMSGFDVSLGLKAEQLAAALRAKPRSLVLLEQIEKADAHVLDILYRVFDEGRLADGRGHPADARNAVFVMSSNLGTEAARERIGFTGREAEAARLREAALDQAQRSIRAELLSRVQEQVVFRPLAEAEVVRILGTQLGEIGATLGEQHGVRLTVDPEAERFLVRAGYSPGTGARELSRTVEKLVRAPLDNLIASGKIAKHKAWRVAYDEGGIYVLPAS